MKNKYFSILVVAIVATVASFNIYSSQKETPMSDLALANVEALACAECPGSHNHGPTRNPLLGKKYCKNENQINCSY